MNLKFKLSQEENEPPEGPPIRTARVNSQLAKARTHFFLLTRLETIHQAVDYIRLNNEIFLERAQKLPSGDRSA